MGSRRNREENWKIQIFSIALVLLLLVPISVYADIGASIRKTYEGLEYKKEYVEMLLESINKEKDLYYLENGTEAQIIQNNEIISALREEAAVYKLKLKDSERLLKENPDVPLEDYFGYVSRYKNAKYKVETIETELNQRILNTPEDSNDYINQYQQKLVEYDKALKEYQVEDIRIRVPLKGDFTLTSAFGPREAPMHGATTYHMGMDFGALIDTPVVAAWPGIVETNYDMYRGNYINVYHGNGVRSRYYHLDKYNVKSGEVVNAGDVIGFVGSTGNSTGPHLHFQVEIDGIPVNPVRILKK